MEKHIQLVGILNIVYRSILILLAIFLFVLSAWFVEFVDGTIWRHGDDIPYEVLNIVPVVVLSLASLMFLFSVIGIIGAIGVLQRKEWGRIMTLMGSFLNLLHIPFGTALGIYSIWVLMKDETRCVFNPTQGGQLAMPAPSSPFL